MKNVLITGCSRGLGAVIVHELIMRQCNVVPHFRKEGSYINLYKTPNIVLGDINEESTRDRIANCLEKNDIEVFINNASIYKQNLFTEHSEQDIIKIINTNLISQILIIRRVYKWLKKRGSGLIINVNSISGIQPAPKEAIYSATKHGLRGFSQSLQMESINSNIKIVDIFPGAMKTDMTIERKNFDQLIEPSEISNIICDVIMNKSITSLTTEIVARKFNVRG
jgi:short-subunit dehydrogenase